MSQPLPDADVLLAAVDADPKLSALAREVAHARGLSIPLRITSITVPTAADAPDYGEVGWSRYDDEHDGTTWYVRLPVVLHTDSPAAEVPPPTPARGCAPLALARRSELVRDEVIADVVCALTGPLNYEDRAWSVDSIAVHGCVRIVEMKEMHFDPFHGLWTACNAQTTRTTIDRAEVDTALHAWAARERKHGRRDPLALELRQSAVEIVETDALYDAEVTL